MCYILLCSLRALPPSRRCKPRVLRMGKREMRQGQMWSVMKCDAMNYQGGHLHKEPGRKRILRWNFLWKRCKKNPCLGVLYGREKGRENIICWLSASPDSHWPRFTPGLNSPPVLLGDVTWLFKKPDPMPHELTHFIQVPEVET